MQAVLQQIKAEKTARLKTKNRYSDYILKELKKSEKEIKAGWISPSFNNGEDMDRWLKNSNRQYENGNKD